VLAHLHNVSGGLVGGDCLHMSVRVGDGASLQLTTTGATRVYRPRRQAPVTVQQNEFRVAEGGLSEKLVTPTPWRMSIPNLSWAPPRK